MVELGCGVCPHHEAITTRLDFLEKRMGLVEKFIIGTLVLFATSTLYNMHAISRVPGDTTRELKNILSTIDARLDKIDGDSRR